ncbi:hypothetical protein CsSME_00008068 [Camellia sinensis var. sinensis]
MEVGRRCTARNGGVVSGSVWESRMKSDEVKGGIKVFNGEETTSEENNVDKKPRPKQSLVGVSGKRKTWKSENLEGAEKNPIQIVRQRSEQTKNLGEQCKELSVSADGIKKSPVVQQKKTRSEVGKELRMSVDGIERSPIQKMKTRSEDSKELNVIVDKTERNPIQIRKAKSESQKLVGQSPRESGGDGDGDGIEKNSIQLRKVKSESNKVLDESVDVNERNPGPLTKSKSVSNKVLEERNSTELKEAISESKEAVDESNEVPDETVEAIEKNPVEIEKIGSDENCKEVDVCEEKVISSDLSNMDQVKSAPQLEVADDGDVDVDGDGDEEDWDEEFDEEVDEEIEMEIEKKSFDVKEIDITEQKPKLVVVKEEKKIHPVQERKLPISPIVKKQAPPLVNHSRIHPIPTKHKASPVSNGFQKAPETHTEYQSIPDTHSKLQSLVDLVMWRDASKSAFVFGLGTFIIISSSYTKDLNISLISVVSYLGLVYLAAIFFFRSIICRGVMGGEDASQDYVVGEEEAIWLLELVLPYLNEFLLKLRALFSGDPVTTMKLAVLLFVLARCGNSITIWKMAKLGFFGVFTVPKICSSYSAQLTACGTFWIRRFRDAWESCSHKKAVAFGIFTLGWNLSSVVARIWAVFMLFVAFRYYHQSVMREDDLVVEEEESKCETSWQGQIGGHRRRRVPITTVDIKKDKKRF